MPLWKLIPVPLLIIIILLQILRVNCTETINKDINVKNISALDTENAKKAKKDENPFRKDVRKFSRECGADVSIEDDGSEEVEAMRPGADDQEQTGGGRKPSNGHWSYESSQNRNNGNKNKKGDGNKGGTYPTHYGNKNSDESEDESDDSADEDDDQDDYGDGDRRQSGRRKNSNRRNNNRHHNHRHGNGGGHDYDNNQDSQEECRDGYRGNRNHGNRGGAEHKRPGSRPNYNSQWYGGGGAGSDRKNYYPYNKGYNGGSRYNNNNNDRYGVNGNSDYYNRFYGNDGDISDLYDPYWTHNNNRHGYSIYGGRLMAFARTKRQYRNSERKSSDTQCLSQCVFGYMEMLDDNRVPAETEVIRYIQTRIFNNSERMKLIRQTRRCFAKLSTTELSDSDDGCAFSKALAQCLNIEIKGETA